MASKNYKLDIFKTMDRITKGDMGHWDNLTEDEQKGFQPFLIQHWLVGVKDDTQMWMMNMFVNPYVFSLGKHKKLLYNLMCASTFDKSKRTFIKRKSSTKFPKTLEIVKVYLGEPKRKCLEYMKMYSNDDILDMADELSYQKSEISELKKELKKRDTSM